MSELRAEIEKAIEHTSDSFHDSTAWFDMGYRDVNGKRYIDSLVDRIEALLTPRLPRVKPEDLVEGKWYKVLSGVKAEDFGQCRKNEFGRLAVYGTLFDRGRDSTEYDLSYLTNRFFGPLPEYELEEA